MNTNNGNNIKSVNRYRNTIAYSIKDAFVLLFYKICSFFPVPKRIREKHQIHNEAAWKDYQLRFTEERYIEHQSAMNKLYYGKRYSADYNSCEVIALYNALISLDDGYNTHNNNTTTNNNIIDFPLLLDIFEHRGITCSGAFGTSPFAIIKYLKSMGYSLEVLNYRKWCNISNDIANGNNAENTIYNFVENNRSFIIMSYNNAGTIRDMIHTMCITKENDNFRIHNDYEGSKYYPSLSLAVNGYKNGNSRVILIIGIKNG